MKCPNCQTELPEKSIQCDHCGYPFRSEEHSSHHSENSRSLDEKEITDDSDPERMLKPPSGFRRTLSTELVERQIELRTLMKLNQLIECRTYESGEVLIHKGDASKDLFFLTEGRVEVSTKSEDGNLILNENEPPYIIGDIAFLSGLHRTATVIAKTKVETFILRYENFQNLFHEFPEWFNPLLTSFVSGIKSLHFKIEDLKREILRLKEN
jgi:hypothetical protein